MSPESHLAQRAEEESRVQGYPNLMGLWTNPFWSEGLLYAPAQGLGQEKSSQKALCGWFPVVARCTVAILVTVSRQKAWAVRS